MPVVVAVAVGGALGALARYGLDRLIEHQVVTVFPWSTFAINLSGCLLVGLATGALVDAHHLPAWVRVGAVVGFLGAYTTFSTFAQETHDLLDGGHLTLALLNATGSMVIGVVFVTAGVALGRSL
jgi:fluoride exporter